MGARGGLGVARPCSSFQAAAEPGLGGRSCLEITAVVALVSAATGIPVRAAAIAGLTMLLNKLSALLPVPVAVQSVLQRNNRALGMPPLLPSPCECAEDATTPWQRCGRVICGVTSCLETLRCFSTLLLCCCCWQCCRVCISGLLAAPAAVPTPGPIADHRLLLCVSFDAAPVTASTTPAVTFEAFLNSFCEPDGLGSELLCAGAPPVAGLRTS